MGDARAVEPLISLLADPNEDVRDSAAGALAQLGDARAVEPLISLLADPNKDVGGNAAGALAQLGDARAVEPLIALLGHADGRVRTSAAKALGQLGEGRWRGAVRGDNDDFRRLGALGDARAAEPLIALLSGGWSVAQGEAVRALGKLGDQRAVEPLIALLSGGPSVGQYEVAQALGKLGDQRAVEPLIGMLGHRDRWVRKSAAQALTQLGEPGWSAAVQGDDDDFTRLGRSGDVRAIRPLLARVGDPIGSVRRTAAKALAQLGEPGWSAAVKGDDDDFTRLGELGDPRAVGPLLAAVLLRDWAEPGLAYAAAPAAAAALARLGDAPALEQVTQAKIADLRASDVQTRRCAARCLKQIHSTAGAPYTAKARILAVASVMAASHTDRTEHNPSGSDCSSHTDQGIGVTL